MDEFDYLNGSLREWLELTYPSIDNLDMTTGKLTDIITDEYLPNFEAAIWKASASANRN